MMKPTEMVQWALDAAAAFATVQQALAQPQTEEAPDGVTENPDGTVTLRRSFRLDPAAVAANGHPAPKPGPQPGATPVRDEAVACCDGKGHDTPLENCKAKNPLYCPFHGIAAMTQNFAGYLKQYGLATPNGTVPFTITKKPSGAFQIMLKCSPIGQFSAENAINAFLAQNGFKGVDGMKAQAAASEKKQLTQAFKQDAAQAPDAITLLKEMQEALLEDEAQLGSDQHLELLSMLAELDGADPSHLTDDQQSLLAQAQAAYHQMKAQQDFKDIATPLDVMEALAKMTEQSDTFFNAASKMYVSVQAIKKEMGLGSSPKGFPGNPEYGAAYRKIFGYKGYDPKKNDKGCIEAAKEAVLDAFNAEDMTAAKEALYYFSNAISQLAKHTSVFVDHAGVMVENFDKLLASGVDLETIKHNSFQKNKELFAKLGITYPEELQKDLDDAAQQAKTMEGAPLPAKEPAAASEPKKQKPQKIPASNATGALPGEMNFPNGLENLKPLAHDESKFPQNITMSELEQALLKGSPAGGGGGLNTQIVTIGGKKYICKAGTGSGKKAIENGYACDMAYRAGGVHAPDAKLYTFGNKTYKLAEFIEGTRLDALITSKSGNRWEVPQSVKDELLKGYPLDALFSNWDVLGTNQGDGLRYTNIIVDKDGHCWRVDNDGAFGLTGVGGEKNLVRARNAYCAKNKDGSLKVIEVEVNGKKVKDYEYEKCAFEQWDEKGGWSERQWIDDFRTMRLDAMNNGVFDQYTTHRIFDAASRIDFHNAVVGLPDDIKAALAKPLAEMREMVSHAKGTNVAGYRMGTTYSCGGKTVAVDPVSIALDSLYDAARIGARDTLKGKAVSWSEKGWISSAVKTNYNIKDYESVVKKPDPPPGIPSPGEDYAKSVLEGVKTINFHVDEGNFKPNQTRIAKAVGCKPALEALVQKNGNEKAKKLLSIIQQIEDAGKNGYTQKLTFDTPNGMMDVAGLSLLANQAQIDAAEVALKPEKEKYEKALAKWEKDKKVFDAKEKKKAEAAGAPPATNFIQFMESFVSDNYDTNGVKRGGGHPEVNEASKDDQKTCSWNELSCRKKVRQYAMMGIPLEAMLGWKDDDKTFYNGNGTDHVSGHDKDGKDDGFHPAIQFYQKNPSMFKRDMEAYARHKALLYLAHYNIENPSIDHVTNTIWAQRKEKSDVVKKYKLDANGASVIPHYPIDCSASAQINGEGTIGSYSIGFKLPMWRVTDCWLVGDKYDSEKEICINPIRIPYKPMYCAGFKSWEDAMKTYNALPETQAIDQKIASVFA